MAKFKPGERPVGRVKGTPNKVTASVRAMIEAALTGVGGVKYLQRQAEENPAAFMALVGKILPMQLATEGDKPLIIVTRAE